MGTGVPDDARISFYDRENKGADGQYDQYVSAELDKIKGRKVEIIFDDIGSRHRQQADKQVEGKDYPARYYI